MPDRPPDEFEQTIRSDDVDEDAGRDGPREANGVGSGRGGMAPDDGRTIAADEGSPGPDPDDLSLDEGATLRQSLHDGGADGIAGDISIEQRFDISDQLGEGGMGVVYKAKDRRLGRMVALKRLKGDTKENQQTIERFWREARTIASLDHFNIVRIYNVFDDREGLWIEMELIEGGTLQELIDREGALPVERVVEIGCQLCDALAISHFRGIIHRDIKPANVLLTDRGTPKLADFGLAHETEVDSKYTVTGALLGTMHYAAPEQMVSGKHVDGRADIYALGATLYAAVTGSSPRVVRLDQVPEQLREIIAKCMEENPSGRFTKMEELGEALREAIAEETRRGVARADVGCPKCDWENPPDVRFCQKCGEDLSSLFEKCPKCERENRVDAEFCGGCGVQIVAYREATKAISDATELIEQFEYDDAITLIDGAVSHGARVDELESLRDQAERGKKATARIVAAQQEVENKEWDRALEIVSEGLNFRERKSELQSLKEKIEQTRSAITQLKAQADQFRDDGKFDKAIDHLERLHSLVSSERGSEIRSEINEIHATGRSRAKARRFVAVALVLLLLATLVGLNYWVRYESSNATGSTAKNGGGLAHLDIRIVPKRADISEQLQLSCTNAPVWVSDELKHRFIDAVLDNVVHDKNLKNGIDDQIVLDIRSELLNTGWFKRIENVQLISVDHLRINVTFAAPFAVVHYGGAYSLIDDRGWLLPLVFPQDPPPQFVIIKGNRFSPPVRPGRQWEGADIAAAIELQELIEHQAWRDQVRAIDVAGFYNDESISIVTDRGTRIVWGSVPGEEKRLEAPVDLKLAWLDHHYEKHHHIDAGHTGEIGITDHEAGVQQ